MVYKVRANKNYNQERCDSNVREKSPMTVILVREMLRHASR
ncbi:hypothetical protein ANACOL_02650 [Anaerotruncus colihominis DSM 17241]|uniref:Uncharacterized protein n=1 Tax=Anaerotruncus colihominis DSM 17241 TaxID=445972 RepID=B0PCY7_9FIRM|nr:hypothetical protein ANACOL_02650 [Anaerotruncus colihominis DSM 17241]